MNNKKIRKSEITGAKGTEDTFQLGILEFRFLLCGVRPLQRHTHEASQWLQLLALHQHRNTNVLCGTQPTLLGDCST